MMTQYDNIMQANMRPHWGNIGRKIALVCCALGLLSACRGMPSKEPPVHLNRNMDTQDKYKPQRISTLFDDGRTMRPQVEGTVGRELLETTYGVDIDGLNHDDRYLRDNDAYWRGVNEDGSTLEEIPSPLKVDMAFLERGQQRYNIYCTPCHGIAGYGNGPVKKRAGLPVPSYHDKYKRALTAGHIYGVISNGSQSGLMMGYKHQIPANDRWAIVAYVRALQQAYIPIALKRLASEKTVLKSKLKSLQAKLKEVEREHAELSASSNSSVDQVKSQMKESK